MRKLVAICLMVFSLVNVDASVEKYLKKIERKSDIHRMRNIDFIYAINLDQRPEKFEAVRRELAPYQIYPYRFSAVNGWELSLRAINELGVKFEKGMTEGIWGTYYAIDQGGAPTHEIISQVDRTYFCHCMARGPIGIVLSHLSVLQDAYNSGYETIWVMEDDIQVVRDPRLLSDLVEQLDVAVGKNGWDVLFTDQNTKNQKGEYVPCLGFAKRPNFTPENPKKFAVQKKVNHQFRKIGARYGAYSMIVRRSGMKKILDFICSHNIFLPYDMDNFLAPGIRFYTVADDVVSTLPNAISDNGGPNYQNKKK